MLFAKNYFKKPQIVGWDAVVRIYDGILHENNTDLINTLKTFGSDAITAIADDEEMVIAIQSFLDEIPAMEAIDKNTESAFEILETAVKANREEA